MCREYVTGSTTRYVTPSPSPHPLVAHKTNIQLVKTSQSVQIFAIFKFRILQTEDPRKHLSGFHAGSHYAPTLVPVVSVTAAAPSTAQLLLHVLLLQPYLGEYADQQLVHVMINADGYFDVLYPECAGQTFAICKQAK